MDKRDLIILIVGFIWGIIFTMKMDNYYIGKGEVLILGKHYICKEVLKND